MKKLMISIAACFGISSVAMTSCQEQLPQTVQEQWEEKQDEVVSAVSAEMQKALKAQLNDFIQNDDLGESLGFSEEQISQLEQYVEEYEFDTEALTKLAGGLENLMEDAKGLTKEEIQEELVKILEK